MTHNFTQSLAAGEYGEQQLDAYFADLYAIHPVSLALQKAAGIDRVWVKRSAPQLDPKLVEYKSDSQGHRTGNVFIETVSNDRTGATGWVFKCVADLLVYQFTGDGTGLVLEPDVLREHIHAWTRKHPVKTASNRTYHSYGVLVPRDQVAAVAKHRFNLGDRP